ncbi:unnamed protein product [Ilex paraguariensis]|uniref:Large ribosomal subunit protein mL46 n=1 Tax=Ilex paraguariensis TaxID=185542 RepID=A0ABC8SCE1_9AQUA
MVWQANSEHPVAKAVVEHAKKLCEKLGSKTKHFTDVNDFVVHPGARVSGKVGDREVLVGNKRLMRDCNVPVGYKVENYISENEQLARTCVVIAIDGRVAGVCFVTDPVKPEAGRVISYLHSMDILSTMVTGDNWATATAIAKEVGIQKVFAEMDPLGKADKIKDLLTIKRLSTAPRGTIPATEQLQELNSSLSSSFSSSPISTLPVVRVHATHPRIGFVEMQRSCTSLTQSLRRTRGFCTSKNSDKIVASVLFERLPIVIPKIDPAIYVFQEFSFRWRQQYRRAYPDEFLKKSDARGKGDYQIDYKPAPRITEADKTNDRRSLQRALDRRLYLLIYGTTDGASTEKPVWHFPEKAYGSEETLRKCAESALESVIGDLSHTYFVGNAPMGHMVIQPAENEKDLLSLKRFFFKSQVIATNKFKIEKCEDFVWVTKDELLEYFPEQAEFLNKMIIS